MKVFVRGLRLVLLFACFLGCNKETISEEVYLEETITQQEENFTVETTAYGQIPEVVSEIEKISGKKALRWTLEKSGDSDYWIDQTDVLKVVDSVGNKTYAFRIGEKVPDSKVMYNLIATERADGNNMKPFVMRYKFLESNRYEYALQENRSFKGTIDVISLVEFVDALDLSSRDGDPDPCYQDVDANYDPSSGSSGGGGSGGGAAIGNGPSSGSNGQPLGSLASYHEVYRSRGSVEVGIGSFGEFGTDGEMNKSYSYKIEPDCPEGETLIPINV